MPRKNPSCRWFFKDWHNDEALALCSLAARGLWIELLCLCAENDGYLLIAGKRPSLAALARYCRVPHTSLYTGLKELEKNDVFSRDENGTIYNRRMVRTNGSAEPPRNARPRTPPRAHTTRAHTHPHTGVLPRAKKESFLPTESLTPKPQPEADANGADQSVSSAPLATLLGRSAPLTPQQRASLHWRFLVKTGFKNDADEYVKAINPITGLPPDDIFQIVENAIIQANWIEPPEAP